MIKDLKIIINIVKEYKYKPSFVIWLLLYFYVLKKIFLALLLMFLLINLYLILVLVLNNTLYVELKSDKSFRVLFFYYKANFYINLSKAKNTVNVSMFYTLFSVITWRILFVYTFGIGFKIFKMCFIYYEIALLEFNFYDLREKKIRVYIVFLKRTLYYLVKKEFVFENEIPFSINIVLFRVVKKIVFKLIND